MAIPRDKLVSWSRAGKNQNSRDTYAKMSKVVADNYQYAVDMYLQGSYSNSTNVRDNSDIDIVVQLKGISINDTNYNSLSSYGAKARLKGFRDELYKSINGKQNFMLQRANKTIQYNGDSFNYVPADIVPCIEYVNPIYSNLGVNAGGIAIFDHEHQKIIVNYPKKHLKNGEDKSSQTSGNYKKTVRMFKNARNELAKINPDTKKLVTSYFLECLLYNVPNIYFEGNEETVFLNVLKYISENRNNMSNFTCQNGIIKLFGSDSTQWNERDAKLWINAVVVMWNNWGSK